MEEIIRAAMAVGIPEIDQQKLRAELERDLAQRIAALDVEQACKCERFDQFSLAVDSRNCPLHRTSSGSATNGGDS